MSILYSPGRIWRLAILISMLVPGIAAAQTVSTSFEDNPDGDFSIGASPVTATFTNGEAMTVGNPSLYRSGVHSWHISPGTTAVVTFETDASDVDLWFRNASGAGPSEVRVIDVDGSVLATTPGSQTFQNVAVSRNAGDSLIARVEVENSGNSGDVVVDDFSFTAEQAAPPPPGPTPLDDPIPQSISVGTEIQLAQVAAGLTAPVWATYAPGDATRLFIVDQAGLLIALDLATGQTGVFHDLTGRLVPLGAFGPGSFDERGFLGVAFHPDFAANGFLYTYTSEPLAGPADFSTMPDGVAANHQSVITEWLVPMPLDPTSSVAPGSAREILRIDEPQFNHNAGALAFDANGYLYIAVGDGGGADDVDGQDFIGSPLTGHGDGNGKNPANPLGTILRIDPTGDPGASGRAYAIPTTNPFFGQAGFAAEIFAYGLRNPFRMSFDSMTGELYVADVGQNDIEEVNVVSAGDNLGWNYKEGTFFFDANGNEPGFVTDTDPGVPAGLVDPIAQYDHDEGVAIIGGFVYRNGSIPGLDGSYVFGDFGGPTGAAGRLFYLEGAATVTEFDIRGRDDLGASLLGFGRDLDGNIYVLANQTGTPDGSTGVVYRIDSGPGRINVAASAVTVSENAATVTISVERTGGNNGPASVDYATQAGTAAAGSDFAAVAGTLDWADGETGAKTVDIAITDDTSAESGETFVFALSNALGADLGPMAEVTLTISANDAPPPPPRSSGGGAIGGVSLLLLLLLVFANVARTGIRNRRA